jgi:hypothetical protein
MIHRGAPDEPNTLKIKLRYRQEMVIVSKRTSDSVGSTDALLCRRPGASVTDTAVTDRAAVGQVGLQESDVRSCRRVDLVKAIGPASETIG